MDLLVLEQFRAWYLKCKSMSLKATGFFFTCLSNQHIMVDTWHSMPMTKLQLVTAHVGTQLSVHL